MGARPCPEHLFCLSCPARYLELMKNKERRHKEREGHAVIKESILFFFFVSLVDFMAMSSGAQCLLLALCSMFRIVPGRLERTFL